MRHSWVRDVERDVDLVCEVHRCDRCGVRLPARVDLEEDDLTSYGVDYDCDVQVVRYVMRL